MPHFLTYLYFPFKSSYLFIARLLNRGVVGACKLLNVNMNAFGSINWWGFSPALDFWSNLSLKDADKNDVDRYSGKDAVHTLGCLLVTRRAWPIASGHFGSRSLFLPKVYGCSPFLLLSNRNPNPS